MRTSGFWRAVSLLPGAARCGAAEHRKRLAGKGGTQSIRMSILKIDSGFTVLLAHSKFGHNHSLEFSF
jgi:hypothetical protein